MLWNPKNKEDAYRLSGGKNYKENEIAIERRAISVSREVVDRSVFLDFGCGPGRFFPHWKKLLVPRNVTVYGVDSSQDMLNFCDKDVKTYLVTDQGLPFPDKSIDFIFSNGVFIHLDISSTCLLFREFSRVTKDDGVMIHDIMDGDNQKAVERVIANRSRKNSFPPIYCYSMKEIEAIADYDNFRVETFSRHRIRNLMKFTKPVHPLNESH